MEGLGSAIPYPHPHLARYVVPPLQKLVMTQPPPQIGSPLPPFAPTQVCNASSIKDDDVVATRKSAIIVGVWQPPTPIYT